MNRYQQLRAIRGTFGYSNRATGGARSGRDLVNVARSSGRVTYSGS